MNMSKRRANGQRDLTSDLSYLRDASSGIFALLGQGLPLPNVRPQRNAGMTPNPLRLTRCDCGGFIGGSAAFSLLRTRSSVPHASPG